MDLTREEAAEWEQHPTTQKVLQFLEEEVQEIKDRMLLSLGEMVSERIALRAMLARGEALGLNRIRQMLQELKEEQ